MTAQQPRLLEHTQIIMNHNYIPNLFLLLEAFAKPKQNKTKNLQKSSLQYTLPKSEPKAAKSHSRSPTLSVHTKSCASEKLKDSPIKHHKKLSVRISFSLQSKLPHHSAFDRTAQEKTQTQQSTVEQGMLSKEGSASPLSH